MVSETVVSVAAPRLGAGDEVVQTDPRLREEVAGLIKGTDLRYCMQCGVCSASCPSMQRMQHGPRRLMHMIYLGLVDEVLSSPDLWSCVTCYSCASRCPQGIAVTDIIARLRNLAVRTGSAKDRESVFSRVFVQVIGRHGRMYEPEVLLRYYAALSSLGGLLKQAGLGLRMLRKGKIGLLPEEIEEVDEVSRITQQAKREE
jgi:heterodisulfide reductase subunit C